MQIAPHINEFKQTSKPSIIIKIMKMIMLFVGGQRKNQIFVDFRFFLPAFSIGFFSEKRNRKK